MVIFTICDLPEGAWLPSQIYLWLPRLVTDDIWTLSGWCSKCGLCTHYFWIYLQDLTVTVILSHNTLDFLVGLIKLHHILCWRWQGCCCCVAQFSMSAWRIRLGIWAICLASWEVSWFLSPAIMYVDAVYDKAYLIYCLPLLCLCWGPKIGWLWSDCDTPHWDQCTCI